VYEKKEENDGHADRQTKKGKLMNSIG